MKFSETTLMTMQTIKKKFKKYIYEFEETNG